MPTTSDNLLNLFKSEHDKDINRTMLTKRLENFNKTKSICTVSHQQENPVKCHNYFIIVAVQWLFYSICFYVKHVVFFNWNERRYANKKSLKFKIVVFVCPHKATLIMTVSLH